MSLAHELASTVDQVRAALPEPAFTAIAGSIADLQASRAAAGAVGVGAHPALPALQDAHGEAHDLQALLERGPIVLTFYRGGWCPYCNVSLRALQAELGPIHALGAELVAVTPETPDHLTATSERVAAAFPILHDPGNAFARSLGLVLTLPEKLRPVYASVGIDLPAYNGDEDFSLPIPATYVIEPGGKVVYAFVDADFTRRAEPSDILQALRNSATPR